jgi:hypothetical protein
MKAKKDTDTMDIYSKLGDKVRYAYPANGYEIDRKRAAMHLVVSYVYTVESVEVGNWHSYVYLKEFPNIGFNTVMFSNVRK